MHGTMCKKLSIGYHVRESNVKVHFGGRSLLRYYDMYQRLQLQFYILLMMGAIDTRNM